MPTYTLTVPANRIDAAQKARAAASITRVHNEVTGAASFFAQVIIHEIPDGAYFVGGKPLSGEQMFLHGQIRSGRSAPDRKRLLLALHQAVTDATSAEPSGVWVYLIDVPARDMIEYGHILPEPGDETTWMATLPEKDRNRMQSI